MTDKKEEKVIPIEVIVTNQPEQKKEEPSEDEQYHDNLEITKEEIEEFEKDGS